MTFTITHTSGDRATALDLPSAVVAARTLILDNDGGGWSRIKRGRRLVGLIRKDGAGWRGWVGRGDR